MIMIIEIVTGLLLLFTNTHAECRTKCCYRNHPDVPDEIGCYNDCFPFMDMPLPDCNDDIQVSMRVYTRADPDKGHVITKTTVPANWRRGKRTHFVVHGYTGSRHAFYLHRMKNAGLRGLWQFHSLIKYKMILKSIYMIN